MGADVPCAPPSRNPAKEVAAVLAVLGSRTAETPGIRSLDTRGTRASRRAKKHNRRSRRRQFPRPPARCAAQTRKPAHVVVAFAVVLGSKNAEAREAPSLSTRGSKVSRPANHPSLQRALPLSAATDVPCAPPSRNPAKAAAAVLAGLGTKTVETPGIRSLDTRGSRASRRAKQVLPLRRQAPRTPHPSATLFCRATLRGVS